MTEATLNGRPGSASGRSYLRTGLPAVYQTGDRTDFGMRFLTALEMVLDPVVALLDNLPSHFDPELAPADLLTVLGDWLAVEHHEAWALDEQRELVRHAAEMAVKRGTKAGLKLALALGFPGIPMRIEDGGGVRYGAQAGADPAGLKATDGPSFVVYCEVPVSESKEREIARFITIHKPVHVRFKLRVRNPPPVASQP
jgi:phage tail-like protein